jgi:hypothetical protein
LKRLWPLKAVDTRTQLRDKAAGLACPNRAAARAPAAIAVGAIALPLTTRSVPEYTKRKRGNPVGARTI